MTLNSIHSAKNTLNKLIRSYHNNEISTEKFKAECYALNILLSFQKEELNQDIEKRIKAIEEKINE